jgi:ABC-type branched-subunit amino acid transport system permease subunit
LFGEAFSGLAGTRPELGSLISGDDRDYYYVTLVVVVVCAAAVLALSRTRLGLYLRGMSESATALNTLGLNVNITRVIVFATSAFFAGVAGALYIGQIGRLSALSFNAAYSLLYLAVFVVASVLPGMLVPAIVAAGLLVVLPSYISSVTLEVQSMLFGGSAVVMAVLADRSALWAAWRARLDSRLDATVASGERRIRSGPMPARTAMARSSAGGQR